MISEPDQLTNLYPRHCLRKRRNAWSVNNTWESNHAFLCGPTARCQYAGSNQSFSYCGLSSDMTVCYTLENVWARLCCDSLVNFRDCLSLTVHLYITQYLKVIGLTHLLAVKCPYCCRNYTCGDDKDFDRKITTVLLKFICFQLIQSKLSWLYSKLYFSNVPHAELSTFV